MRVASAGIRAVGHSLPLMTMQVTRNLFIQLAVGMLRTQCMRSECINQLDCFSRLIVQAVCKGFCSPEQLRGPAVCIRISWSLSTRKSVNVLRNLSEGSPPDPVLKIGRSTEQCFHLGLSAFQMNPR